MHGKPCDIRLPQANTHPLDIAGPQSPKRLGRRLVERIRGMVPIQGGHSDDAEALPAQGQSSEISRQNSRESTSHRSAKGLVALCATSVGPCRHYLSAAAIAASNLSNATLRLCSPRAISRLIWSWAAPARARSMDSFVITKNR